jgi:hypothetical protein
MVAVGRHPPRRIADSAMILDHSARGVASPMLPDRRRPIASLPLGYCANVHPGPGLKRSIEGLLRTGPAVAAELRAAGELEGPLPVGLWLSEEAAREVEAPGAAERLRDELARAGIRVAGFNGFPMGDFHGQEVKHRVYRPHWADPRRLEHTLRLASILPRLLPAGVREAGVTTVPVGWRGEFADAAAIDAAVALLRDAAVSLERQRDDTGVVVHLDLEPEPGCLLERAGECAAFLDRVLDGVPPSARGLLRACHDVCHAAVLFEEQEESLQRYRDRGILVGRVQISSGVHFDGTAGDFRLLRPFEEPRWLHQTAVLDGRGTVHAYEDLPEAIEQAPEGYWRIHFHVPVFAESLGRVETTRSEIAACLDALRPEDGCDFLEIETYAWSVLPASMRPASLEEGIAAEIRFVRQLLDAMPA